MNPTDNSSNDKPQNPSQPVTFPASASQSSEAPASLQNKQISSSPAPIEPSSPAASNTIQPIEMQSQQAVASPQTVHDLEPPADVMRTAAIDDRKRSIINSIRGFISFAVFVATVVIAAMLINQFIFQSYYVDGTSMTPTLQNNDRLIIDKTSKTFAAIQGKRYVPSRGSIVILDSSILDQFGHDEQLIKRVIGLPGETIHIQDGIVTIKNGQHPEGFNVDDSLGLKLAPTYVQSTLDLTIPDDSVFVMGDNRALNGSFDSRAFGPINTNKIQGRLALRVFPFDHVRTF